MSISNIAFATSSNVAILTQRFLAHACLAQALKLGPTFVKCSLAPISDRLSNPRATPTNPRASCLLWLWGFFCFSCAPERPAKKSRSQHVICLLSASLCFCFLLAFFLAFFFFLLLSLTACSSSCSSSLYFPCSCSSHRAHWSVPFSNPHAEPELFLDFLFPSFPL